MKTKTTKAIDVYIKISEILGQQNVSLIRAVDNRGELNGFKDVADAIEWVKCNNESEPCVMRYRIVDKPELPKTNLLARVEGRIVFFKKRIAEYEKGLAEAKRGYSRRMAGSLAINTCYNESDIAEFQGYLDKAKEALSDWEKILAIVAKVVR